MDWAYIPWAALCGGMLLGYALCMGAVIATMIWDGRLKRRRRARR